ncbi:phosphodiester glycosidase family protein [Streptomyces sp. NPDC050560]|uniref:phosphodiester glycosidase family protein n=1 Tax=Streptomyces sp. NPDC050560 TaxID=3365630 RepID=UPI00379EE94A
MAAGTKVDYLSGDGVSRRETVSDLAAAHDPGKGRRTVAAINGDFFDIDETGAPEGVGVTDGGVVNSPAPSHTHAIGFGPADAGRVLDLYFDGTLKLPSGGTPLAGLNAANVPVGGIGAYTSQWGDASRALTVNDGSRGAEVTVVDGKVASAPADPGSGPIPAGATVLVGSDAGADTLRKLAVGTPVSWEFHPRADSGKVPSEAIGANEYLVRDGAAVDHEGEGNNATAPRTAVGFSRDGRTVHVVTVDGRQADSGGLTLTELGRMLKDAGSYNAINLDGGGSSTLVARQPGSDALQLENQPSDGTERTVPNGLAFTAPDGSGRLTAYRVATAMDAPDAPTVDPVAGGHPDRVFPGLTRHLTAAGYDETYGPAKGAPRWRTADGRHGRVDAHGVFTARRGGTVKVTAERGRAKGSLALTVLGGLDHVVPTAPRIGLPDEDSTGSFGVVGLDAAGDSAPVEPSDVQLDYDHALFKVSPTAEGFTVRAREPDAAGTVTAKVAGHTTALAVTAGLTEQPVAGFDDASDWTFTQARAAGSVGPAPDGHTGTGLTMSYDFTRSTATRAAYANPPAEIPVAGQPKAFAMWIKGDGNGAWATLHLKDATGTDQLLRGPYVDWTGWKRVEFPVPDSVAYPVSVNRFYLAETDATAQYTGEITMDDLVAEVPPEVDLPQQQAATDPLISTARDVRGRDWRFAVMSDAQFVAREPDSPIVAQARRTLREIRAAKPDFVVVDGDLVDEGSPEDLAFAHRVLDEELGDAVPWYYVPGNHEVMGGTIDNFTAEFGPAHRVFDHEGTRFLTLDTSALGIRASGFSQLKDLKRQLDEADRDRKVRNVVVVEHVPPRDPTPQKGSQLSDRKEAALLEQWLSAFQRDSGKGVAFVGGHVGTFHAQHVDGVPYLINGNSGKNPSTPADQGGFTGWSLVGVDRAPQGHTGDWVSVQTRAHVDSLALDTPGRLVRGHSVKIAARLTQGERTVPVAWPVSADWSGSRVAVTTGRHPGHGAVAAYDPATTTLTGLRPGTGTLKVSVNGVAEEVRVTVAGR